MIDTRAKTPHTSIIHVMFHDPISNLISARSPTAGRFPSPARRARHVQDRLDNNAVHLKQPNAVLFKAIDHDNVKLGYHSFFFPSLTLGLSRVEKTFEEQVAMK